MKPPLAFVVYLVFIGSTFARKHKSVQRGREQPGLVSDIIDIDADHGDSAFEVDGSGDGFGDDEGNDDGPSGDDLDEASGDVTMTECEAMRKARERFFGAYVPQCASDGSFHVKQCHGSTGECWCVNPEDGKELHGSRGRGQVVFNCANFVEKSKTSATTASTRDRMGKRTTTSKPRTVRPPRVRTTNVRLDTTTARTRFSTGTSFRWGSSTPLTEPINKLDQIPNEPEIEMDTPPDIDSNYVERPYVYKTRKQSFRDSVIGQPGILAAIIGGAVIVLICLVLLVMFIVYRMHRKSSRSPAIYYIDKPTRTSFAASNKKAGYMKALDHDVYG